MEQEAKMETGRGSHEGTGRLPSPGAGVAGGRLWQQGVIRSAGLGLSPAKTGATAVV